MALSQLDRKRWFQLDLILITKIKWDTIEEKKLEENVHKNLEIMVKKVNKYAAPLLYVKLFT